MEFHPLHQQQIIGLAYSIGVGKNSRKGWAESYSMNAVVYGVETCFIVFTENWQIPISIHDSVNIGI